MAELFSLVLLLAGDMAIAAVARSLIRVLIGAEVVVVAEMRRAAPPGGLSLVAGVAETAAAAVYGLAEGGYV